MEEKLNELMDIILEQNKIIEELDRRIQVLESNQILPRDPFIHLDSWIQLYENHPE